METECGDVSLAWWQCTAVVVGGDGMVVPDTQLCGTQQWNGGTRYYYVYQILWIIFNDMPRVVQLLREASTLHQEWVDNWGNILGSGVARSWWKNVVQEKSEGP